MSKLLLENTIPQSREILSIVGEFKSRKAVKTVSKPKVSVRASSRGK
jgi:hypothetical protein